MPIWGASDSLRMDEIMKSFTGINAALAQINTDMDTAHGELKTLIETVRTEAGENQRSFFGVLDRIDTSFTEQNSQNYDALVQSLNSQTEAMKAQLEGHEQQHYAEYGADRGRGKRRATRRSCRRPGGYGKQHKYDAFRTVWRRSVGFFSV